jgi:methionyl-tRNA synthetase
MAKDNVPFHAIMFPAMLLGTRQPWQQPTRIKGFNWLNYYGGKFSTSSKRGVFLDVALELFPSDVWRYALLSIAPESKDGAFTWEEFQQKVNKDLNDNLGNFVNRVLRFSAARFGETVPAGGSPGPDEVQLQEQTAAQAQRIAQHLEELEFRKASEALRDFWALGNLYIDRRAPWKSIDTNRDDAALVIRTCINMIRLHGTVCEPFIPDTATQIHTALGLEGPDTAVWSGDTSLTKIEAGHPFTVPAPLFKKIDAKEITALKERFGAES